MTAVDIHQGAALQQVKRRIAWLECLQMLRRAALPLAAIGAVLGVMVSPIIFPLVAVVVLVVLAVGSRRARTARPRLLADISELGHLDLVPDPELARFRSTVDRVTRGHRSQWSSVM